MLASGFSVTFVTPVRPKTWLSFKLILRRPSMFPPTSIHETMSRFVFVCFPLLNVFDAFSVRPFWYENIGFHWMERPSHRYEQHTDKHTTYPPVCVEHSAEVTPRVCFHARLCLCSFTSVSQPSRQRSSSVLQMSLHKTSLPAVVRRAAAGTRPASNN